MIARVRGVMRASSCPASSPNVTGSQSTSTGTPPLWSTASAQEMIVNDGMMTSSPGCRPSVSTASCNALVPLLTATPYFIPQNAAQRCSNSSMNLPAEETQPVRMHSAVYSASRSPNTGSLTGIMLEALLLFEPGVRALLDLEEDRV